MSLAIAMLFQMSFVLRDTDLKLNDNCHKNGTSACEHKWHSATGTDLVSGLVLRVGVEAGVEHKVPRYTAITAYCQG